MDVASLAEGPIILLGSARLPRSLGGDRGETLMIEFTLDGRDLHVVDVAATVALPGYIGLLQRFLIGRRLEEVEGAARQLCAHLRGPLLRPTFAALTNAVSNSTNGVRA